MTPQDAFVPTAETTVSQVVEAGPALRRVLQSRGIDLCCGGMLTLAQAAEVREVPVEELLAALRAALPAPAAAPAPAPKRVEAGDSVRAVLKKWPHVAPVLERHGLLGCGGAEGPDERLDLFASVHKVDLAKLLSDLETAIDAPPAPAPAGAPAPEAPSLHGPFLRTALWCTLTLGATFGAYNLFAFQLALGPALPAHNWAHADFQVLGFVWLFVAGVSYTALPRFFSVPLARPGLARATYVLALLGLAGRFWGHLVGPEGAVVPGTPAALAAGSAFSALAVVGWAWVLAATARRATLSRDTFEVALLSGTLWWVVAVGVLVAGALHGAIKGNVAWAVFWHEPFYSAALYGGTLLWIQGMLLRTAPAFLGLRTSRGALVKASLVLAHGGALLAVAGGLGLSRTHLVLRDAGLLLTALSVGSFVAGLRVLEPADVPEGDRDFGRVLRVAAVSGLLFVAIGAGHAVADLAGKQPGTLVLDGARHAFTLGFVTLTILAMATRIVPVFVGAPLHRPSLRLWGAVLVGAGIVLREAEVASVLFEDKRLLYVSGCSGIVAALGVVLACIPILGTLRGARHQETPPPPPGPVAIDGDANVAALVDAHPEALAVLVGAGFATLASPAMRATLARRVTLRQACGIKSVDLGKLLEALRRAHQEQHEAPGRSRP